MIEPIMYFGVGFLAAALLGLIIVPFVHGRAVRLTVRRLEAATPLSMAEIQADEDQLEVKVNTLRETERRLADKEAEFEKASAQLTETTATSDGQRVEIVALKTQIDNLKDQVSDLGRQVKDTEERYAREKEASEKATKDLAQERGTVEALGTRVAQLERQLATQTNEAEIMGRRIADMEMRLTEQGRVLADRERERDQLRIDADAARRIEADLRQELGTIERRHGTATEALRAEKTLAESQLERAREDRAKLQRELSAMKREAEATWASERVENALLRERINDVAAEVARLTSVLEGPGSTIDTILAAPEHAPGTNGSGKPVMAQPANTNGHH